MAALYPIPSGLLGFMSSLLEVCVERARINQFTVAIHLHPPSFRLIVASLEPQYKEIGRAAETNFSYNLFRTIHE